VGSVLTSGKEAGKITGDSPGNAKEQKQDNENKLIKKNQ
jgi:hypothetical protein